jgi:hypothetical protein
MSAPTRLLGATDPFGYSNTMMWDALEHVPELQPGMQSALVYSRMRREPRLAAILAGYTLQIRRASWRINPAGCRPEVVKQVADDMGLQVMGDDEPGAARTKGVSWNDHLRSALMFLVYGHMDHELLAEIDDSGKARLVALAERMPHTVFDIRSDPATGAFLGIDQNGLWSNSAPQIPADRLAHYVHDKESSWAGTSLFRSSWAPFYLKTELVKIHATSARRFAMGVPTVEWAPGTDPTPSQIAHAQQLASAARAGEESGASLPPGASLVLRGLTGSVVDALAFIKFLNSEMAIAALMPHMDLGTSETGSRAVASEFVDNWMLALGSIADEIADVATRQIAARIVGWNYTDEPVPRVVASGIGAEREVTAESLNLLLTSGALAADPALEAWIRREYRLPERDKDSPFEVRAPKGQYMTVPGTGGDGDPTGPPQPVPATPGAQPDTTDGSAKGGDAPPAAQQLSLFADGVAAAEGHHHGGPHFDSTEKRDKDGKWTRGGGAGKAEAAAAEVERPKRRQLRVRTALANAKTLGDVEQVSQAEARRVRRGKYGETTFSFESDNPVGVWEESSLASAREHAEGVLRVLEIFPRADISRIRVAHPREDEVFASSNAYAYARGGEIVFNLAWSAPAHRRAYLAQLRSDAKSGWTSANSGTPIAVGIHEAAHVVDIQTLKGVAHADASAAYRDAFRAVEKGRKKNEGITYPVSTYAATDNNELIAEATTDAIINGEGADPVSKEVFGALSDTYDEAVVDSSWAGGMR